ncbi:hypothetical protein ATN89_10970 [Comamonas thiooxydans]|nr:hypothetical protein ATN89_10970 [Comamonas thiooxydans]
MINDEYFQDEFFKNIFVNIDDERNDIFAQMINSEKMYYHNSVWLNKFGENYYSKYDLCIKLRSDARVVGLNLDEMLTVTEKGAVTEDVNGYFLRPWGLGVGDQVIFSNAKDFVQLMKVWNDKQICKIFDEFGVPKYMGHANIANVSLKKGIKIFGNDFFKISLESSERISDAEISNLIVKYKGEVGA